MCANTNPWLHITRLIHFDVTTWVKITDSTLRIVLYLSLKCIQKQLRETKKWLKKESKVEDQQSIVASGPAAIAQAESSLSCVAGGQPRPGGRGGGPPPYIAPRRAAPRTLPRSLLQHSGTMKCLLILAAVQAVLCGDVSEVAVRLPFLNPAGVTYLNGPAPAELAAGPLAYAAQAGYAAAPAAYAAAPLGYAAAPAAAVGYAHAQVPAVAAVPTVHHVPGVADVPVTRVQANHGVVQSVVDVAHPAVSTRRFEIRRPAIQKQFYDIEERVVVRPAGSALVELDQPSSKLQRGPAVVSPLGAAAAVPVAGVAGVALPAAPVAALPAAEPSPVFIGSTPAPPQGVPAGPSGPSFGAPSQFESDGDSISIDNPEFSARAAQARANAQIQRAEQAQIQAAQAAQIQAQIQASEARSRAQTEARAGPSVEVRANGAPLDGLVPAPRLGADVVPSLRSLDPNENQANQQRLIQLLTARGGVAEVGFGRAGPAEGPVGEAGPVRARVLSATPTPYSAAPAGERVSTRRVVVSRPIETLQEVDVVEPVTKLQRVAYNQPTIFKTLHQDIARVPTSVPVYGKALAPAVAHAAVPVQYGLYH